MAVELGLGITPWSPLKGGLLSGKYNPSIEDQSSGTRMGDTRRKVTLSEKEVAILDQHALVHVFEGTLELYYADRIHRFRPGMTVIIPRNQLGRMIKLPANGELFRSISILFPEQLLRKFYGSRPENVAEGKWTGHLALKGHPLLESLFTSPIPYFEMQDELPPDLVDIKIMECLTVLEACNPQVKRLLSMFHEPGKVDLADFSKAGS